MKKYFLFAALVSFFSLNSLSAFADGEDVKQLFKSKCAGCHGQSGEKKSGGKEPIQNLTKGDISKILDGYAAGTQGGVQKKIMERVVSKVTAEERELLESFIPTLNPSNIPN